MTEHEVGWKCSGLVECPFCVENAKGRSNHAGHFLFRPPRPRRILQMAQYLHKPAAIGVPNAVGEHWGLVSFPPELAALGEFLTEETWPDGSERVSGSMTVFREGAKIKCCLSDKDQGTLAFVSAATWTDLLEWVEAALRGQQLDWRPQRERRR